VPAASDSFSEGDALVCAGSQAGMDALETFGRLPPVDESGTGD